MKKWIPLLLCSSMLIACSDEQMIVSNAQQADKALTAAGEITSLESITISPPSIRNMWQLKIQHLIPENSQVKKGDLLVRFDGQQLRNRLIEKESALEAEVKQREQQGLENQAELQQLQLDLAEAEMNFEKEKRKVEIVDAATKAVEKAKQKIQFQIATKKLAQVKQKLEQFKESQKLNDQLAESKIKTLRSQVAVTKADMAKLSIKSPKGGIIMYRTDHDGEKLAVGDSVWMGRQLMTIPSMDKLAISAKFDEPDTSRIALGTKVKVILEAYPEIPFSGQISSLGQAYTTKSRRNPKIVFDVEIALDEIDKAIMRPGMKVKLEVLKEQSV